MPIGVGGGGISLYTWYQPTTRAQFATWARVAPVHEPAKWITDRSLSWPGHQTTNHLEVASDVIQPLDKSDWALKHAPLFLALRYFGLFAEDYRDFWSLSSDPRLQQGEENKSEFKKCKSQFEDRDMHKWLQGEKSVRQMYVVAGLQVGIPRAQVRSVFPRR